MNRLRFPALCLAGALFGSCLINAAAACPGWRCGDHGASAGPWMAAQAAVLVILLLGAAILGRAGWLTWQGRRSLATLQPVPKAEAHGARRRVGDRALLTGAAGVAFCTGLLRPQLYLSVEIVDALDDEELEAVLLHEFRHAARRDPLRRVLRRALADVFWFAPALAWWADQRICREEMAADAEAVRRVGLRPVAGALVKLGTRSEASVSSAAYGDAAAARAASLLGDPPPDDRLPLRLVILSAAGGAASIPLSICLATFLV